MALDAFFEEVVKRGGSDLHLAVNQPPLARVRGELVPVGEAPLGAKELEEMLLSIVSSAQRTRLASELELEHSVAYRDGSRFRARYYVKHSGIAGVFRHVPARVPSLADLGAPDVLRALAERASGLVLVAGPPGSGRTALLAAVVGHLNQSRACRVVTLEPTIELLHESARAQIAQREIGTHTPSLAVALRSLMRDNADVVVIGELAGAEEVELALRLAESGLLVFAATAGAGAVSVLERLLAAYDESALPRVRSLFASALAAVIVQHLVPNAEGVRLPVHEILLTNEVLSGHILAARFDDLQRALAAGDEGLQSLDSALERLVSSGAITREAALARAIDREAF